MPGTSAFEFPSPNSNPSVDEIEIREGEAFRDALEMLQGVVSWQDEQMGISSHVMILGVSKSAVFPLVVRAKIERITKSGVIRTLDMVWKTANGETGHSSEVLQS